MRKHLVLVACLFSFFGVLAGGEAAVPTRNDRIARVSTESPISRSAFSPGSKFFDTLAPRSSFRGAVRTFSIQVGPIARLQGREYKLRSLGKEFAQGIADPSFKSYSGPWASPVSGEISSHFGYRRNPFGRGVVFHAGIDIRAPRGTTIRAAGSGRVIFSGWRRGYGLTVVLDHGNGIQTVYAHCTKALVFVGSSVRAGSTIGTVGTTGTTTGSHLHFEFRRNNRLVNPSFIFRR